MPKINESLIEQNVNPVTDSVISTHQKMTVTAEPVLTVSVGRKVNIGNFENVDIMACLSVPVPADPSNKEVFSEVLKEVAAEAFFMVSKETGERYTLIKESQKGR